MKIFKGECHIHYYRKHKVWEQENLNYKGNTIANIEKYYIEEAKRKGLDFIFLTPDTPSLWNDNKKKFDYAFALEKKYNKRRDILVLAGSEIALPGSHILALGIKEHVGCKTNLMEVKTAVVKQGGLVIAAHPHTPAWWNWEIFLDGIKCNVFDGIEFNIYTYKDEISKLEELYRQELRFRKDLCYIGSSDVHGIPEDMGSIGCTYVQADSLRKEDILDGLRKGLCVARYGNKIVGHNVLLHEVAKIIKAQDNISVENL